MPRWFRIVVVALCYLVFGGFGIASPRGKTPADGAIALDRMIQALRAGRTLLVFPEGVAERRIDYRMRALPIIGPEAFTGTTKAVLAGLEARIRSELGLATEPTPVAVATVGASP